MTSPALARPETSPAFVGFVDLLASAHPLRVCADGARAIVDAFDELWPAEDGDMEGVGARLTKARVCGDGLERPSASVSRVVALEPPPLRPSLVSISCSFALMSLPPTVRLLPVTARPPTSSKGWTACRLGAPQPSPTWCTASGAGVVFFSAAD